MNRWEMFHQFFLIRFPRITKKQKTLIWSGPEKGGAYKGIIAQIEVAIELNLTPVNDFSAIKLVQDYQSGKYTRTELSQKMYNLMEKAVLADNPKKKVFEDYKEQYQEIIKSKG